MKNYFYLIVISIISIFLGCTGIYENGKEMAAEAKTVVNEISVEDLKTKFINKEPFLLLDVRKPSEYKNGFINDDFVYSSHLKPINLPRGILEFKIDNDKFWKAFKEEMPDKDSTQIIIYCKSGARGILSAKTLLILGYQNVKNLSGGWNAWKPIDEDQNKIESSSCAGSDKNIEHNTLEDMVMDAKSKVNCITVKELKAISEQGENYIIIDCRQEKEYNKKHIPSAINIPRGVLEFSDKISNRRTKIFIYDYYDDCSALCAETLLKLKYKDVTMIEDGWKKWSRTYPGIYETGSNTPGKEASPKKEEEVGGCG